MAAGRKVRAVAELSWRRAEDRELTPILASALEEFYAKGYHGTSVRDIAKRAGLTVPALYYHHTNKEAVLAALLDGAIDSVIERSKQAVAEAGDDPVARFNNLIECLLLFMAYNGKSAAMDAEVRALSAENRRAYSAKRRVVAQLLEEAIADGIAVGVFHVASSFETSRALLGMIEAISMWYRPGGQLTPHSLCEQYLDIARHAVGAAGYYYPLATPAGLASEPV